MNTTIVSLFPFEGVLDIYLLRIGTDAYANASHKRKDKAKRAAQIRMAEKEVMGFSPPIDLLHAARDARAKAAVPGSKVEDRKDLNKLATSTRKDLLMWHSTNHVE